MPCQPPPSIHYLSYLLHCLTSYIILYHKIILRQTYFEFPGRKLLLWLYFSSSNLSLTIPLKFILTRIPMNKLIKNTKYRRRILNPDLWGYPRTLFSKIMKSLPGYDIIEYNIQINYLYIRKIKQKIKGMENEKNFYKIRERNGRSKSSGQYRNFIHWATLLFLFKKLWWIL